MRHGIRAGFRRDFRGQGFQRFAAPGEDGEAHAFARHRPGDAGADAPGAQHDTADDGDAEANGGKGRKASGQFDATCRQDAVGGHVDDDLGAFKAWRAHLHHVGAGHQPHMTLSALLFIALAPIDGDDGVVGDDLQRDRQGSGGRRQPGIAQTAGKNGDAIGQADVVHGAGDGAWRTAVDGEQPQHHHQPLINADGTGQDDGVGAGRHTGAQGAVIVGETAVQAGVDGVLDEASGALGRQHLQASIAERGEEGGVEGFAGARQQACCVGGQYSGGAWCGRAGIGQRRARPGAGKSKQGGQDSQTAHVHTLSYGRGVASRSGPPTR